MANTESKRKKDKKQLALSNWQLAETKPNTPHSALRNQTRGGRL